MKTIYKILIPVIIILFAVCSYAVMIHFKKKPMMKPENKNPISVKVISARPKDVTLSVKSRGTVKPRTETVLMAEISGKIAYTSPSFHAGSIFNQGDIMIELENGDYLDAVIRSKADLARAKLKLVQEEALARQSKKEWLELGRGNASSLLLREPQLKEARAEYSSAKAQLRSDRRNLKRTIIRAPYQGMMIKKEVNLGQYVSPGTPLATIFAVDFAEIRLPISNRDLAYLEIPNSHINKRAAPDPKKVTLAADLAGVHREWEGWITHTEGIFDSHSRVIYLVAQVMDPYALEPGSHPHPLPMGLFVEAEITGITMKQTIILPRHVLRGNETVLIVTQNNRIQSRKVGVFKSGIENVIIRSGIDPGDRICVTPLEFVVENMPVHLVPNDNPGQSNIKITAGG